MSKESRRAAFAKCAKLNRNGKTHTVKKNPKSGMFSCVKMKRSVSGKMQTAPSLAAKSHETMHGTITKNN